MLYLDYNWDLTSTRMIPDQELNTDTLNWQVGDCWRIQETDTGRKILVKVEPLVEFLKAGEATLGK